MKRAGLGVRPVNDLVRVRVRVSVRLSVRLTYPNRSPNQVWACAPSTTCALLGLGVRVRARVTCALLSSPTTTHTSTPTPHRLQQPHARRLCLLLYDRRVGTQQRCAQQRATHLG